MDKAKEQMNIVIAGHVDHGKSSLIGRLLADTHTLPEGKLEQVKEQCAKNSKPFEYAFLLDALKDEQAQGITIDSARCFFQTEKRHYILIDAPGHIEFLKNMVTGASRAEAALLVIDANEGIQENSRRHGYLISMLGIRQIVVLINKMDIVDYNQEIFENISLEFRSFLQEINVEPLNVIPVSAREGDNLTDSSPHTKWYQGESVLGTLDSFAKEADQREKPFRMPVQDIYKFTKFNDSRRIVAGTIEAGSIALHDKVVFLPSGKRSTIESIEGFNTNNKNEQSAGNATGFTLKEQVYIKPGELMCKESDSLPFISDVFKVHLFWVGKNPMIEGKKYKIKIGNCSVGVFLKSIESIIDASSLSFERNKDSIERHDVAECILQTIRPIALDTITTIGATGRFVIVDNYEISGGGIIISQGESGSYLEEHVKKREYSWINSRITPSDRIAMFNQRPKVIIITGKDIRALQEVALHLEEDLFRSGRKAYYLGISNLISGIDADILSLQEEREEHVRRLGEIAHIISDAGMIFISTIPELDDPEFEMIKTLIDPFEALLITAGEHYCANESISLHIDAKQNLAEFNDRIKRLLIEKEVMPEYNL